MKVSTTWLNTITTPFPPDETMQLRVQHAISVMGTDYNDEIKRIEGAFKPADMARELSISLGNARRLSEITKGWMHCLSGMDIPARLKLRMKNCTMRFSGWQVTKGADKHVIWRRKLRTCGSVKLCPWCRQRVTSELFATMVKHAVAGKLGVLQRTGPIEDKKVLGRAPVNTIAAIRNIVYPHSRTEPEFMATYFAADSERNKFSSCSVDMLKMVLASSVSWNFDLAAGPADRLNQYLQLMSGVRMYSIKR